MVVHGETLAVFRSIWASDVTDALDLMGLQELYEMDPEMRPLFSGVKFAGTAHTAEYDPIDRPSSRCPMRSLMSFNTRKGRMGCGMRLVLGGHPTKCW